MGFYVPACENRFPSLLLTAQELTSNAVLIACAKTREGNGAAHGWTTVLPPLQHSKG